MPKKLLTSAMQILFWVAFFGVFLLVVQSLSNLNTPAPGIEPQTAPAASSLPATLTAPPSPAAYPPPGPTPTLWRETARISIPEGADIYIPDDPPPTRFVFPTATLPADAQEIPVPTPTVPKDAAGVIRVMELPAEGLPAVLEVQVDAQGALRETAAPLRTSLSLSPELGNYTIKLDRCHIVLRRDGLAGAFTNDPYSYWCPGVLFDLQTYLISPFVYGGQIYDWHPDNQQVLRNKDGFVDIVPDKPVAEPRIVDISRGGIDYASFSPDGLRVVYGQETEAGTNALRTVNQWGRNHQTLLEVPATIYFISWSPDSQQIVFYSNGWQLVNADGSNPRMTNVDAAFISNIHAEWSADSQSVLLSYHPRWSPEDFTSLDTWVVDANQTAPLPRKVDSGGTLWSPVWSPDGKYLAFLSDRSGAVEVWICLPDGSNPRQITDDGMRKVMLWWES